MLCARHVLIATTLLLTAFAATGRPQQQQSPAFGHQTAPSVALPDSRNDRGLDPAIVAVEQRQARARNDERQKRLVADTDRLLALATQLHDDVGKTDKNILSIDVVKRAEEIEKLAHNVKERMKG